MNLPPGAFRIWLGRLFWGMILLLPLGGGVLVLVMIAAQLRGLDHSRTVLKAANSLLASAMRAGEPESVPMAVSRLGEATRTTVILLRNDGTSAFSDTRTLDRLKSYTAIPDTWRNAIHSPNLFRWPPSLLPGRLIHEVDRIFSRRSGHLLADHRGQASPLAVKGGYAAWVQAIPNSPSCARCHGFDKEVLGHWVTISRIVPVVDPKGGSILWGFWPLASINQTFLLGLTVVLGVVSVFLVSIAETWSLRRTFRGMVPVKKPEAMKEKGKTEKGEEEGSSGRGGEEASGSYGEWEELLRRIGILDQSVSALIEEIPRPGILPKTPSDETISVGITLAEQLTDWSDRFEMALQELEAHPIGSSDPILMRFLERAREFRTQAVSFVDLAASESEEKSFGVLKSPFFESLTEDQKDWTDRLRAALNHLHAEIRAMEGSARAGATRTAPPKEPGEEPELSGARKQSAEKTR